MTEQNNQLFIKEILNRIRDLKESHHWTEYQLAQNSGIPQSTISSWFRKGMLPTLLSLEKIALAFDMTLAQFLSKEGIWTEITPDQRELLKEWEKLSDNQKQAFLALMKSMTTH